MRSQLGTMVLCRRTKVWVQVRPSHQFEAMNTRPPFSCEADPCLVNAIVLRHNGIVPSFALLRAYGYIAFSSNRPHTSLLLTSIFPRCLSLVVSIDI